ncbi:bifunctional enoyl-CoA hydratase/phosphate acetyltransferase [Lyticum sinuosum]|uniref:Phosphate acetyltransferase n=1 Tax=Lyticum sinuosum TaxID=1332059 RepID=A0AAE5AHU9_9RICK|nr:bifunctional enoyl-CoA hydratase/phosphate acetyltransferase [Lyticum sinuosum]MDZ5761416.1 Phosphate acetyltransferase [Lyticum sinuosum]
MSTNQNSYQLHLNSEDPKNLYAHLIHIAEGFKPMKVAVVHANDMFSFESSLEAAKMGIIDPIFIGTKSIMEKMSSQLKTDINQYEIIDSDDSIQSAIIATQMAKENKVKALIKGKIHTDDLMLPIVSRTSGLRVDKKRISHVFIVSAPNYHKPLFLTDAAINIDPDLNTKVSIIQNAIDLFISIYKRKPKVAIISAVETVTERLPSTIHAAALCKMTQRGQIINGIVDGPLAFDNAISKEAAISKGVESEVSGDPDILVAPNIEAGNMLYKQMRYMSNIEGAGIVVGAKVPVILTSRSEEEIMSRIASCAIAVAMQNNNNSI